MCTVFKNLLFRFVEIDKIINHVDDKVEEHLLHFQCEVNPELLLCSLESTLFAHLGPQVAFEYGCEWLRCAWQRILHHDAVCLDVEHKRFFRQGLPLLLERLKSKVR